MPVVFCYSGQGSQFYRMGLPLFEEEPVFRRSMLEMDEHVKARLGVSVVDALYRHAPPATASGSFTQTLVTHPAIFMVQRAMTELLAAKGVRPDAVLGMSLGEFAAAAAAGALSVEHALDAVLLQAELLEDGCPEGGMMAVLGAPRLLETLPELAGSVTLVSVNAPEHFVLAGDRPTLERLRARLRELRVPAQLLPVSRAFHSAAIDGIAARFAAAAAALSAAAAPRVPLLSCAEGGAAAAFAPGPHLWRAVREPIRLRETVQAQAAQQRCLFVDLGPSGTVAALLRLMLAPGCGSRSQLTMDMLGRDRKHVDQLLQTMIHEGEKK
ncbi:acyltransferase domain-containing protein [Paenibacillus athensensis]|nr:acyltransferase domain-containing protein [Paenibacillus athensensis]